MSERLWKLKTHEVIFLGVYLDQVLMLHLNKISITESDEMLYD